MGTMRVFWAIIAVLGVLTAVLLLRDRAKAPAPVVLEEPASMPATADATPASPSVGVPPAKVEAPVANPAEVPDAPVTKPVEPPAVEAPKVAAPVAEAVPAVVEEKTDTIAAIDAPKEAAPVVAAPKPEVAPAPASTPTSVPVKLEAQADGWTRVDDRFMIRGAGTAEDPYVLPWDLLVSASETYRPRLGRKIVPDRVTMLNGKHVRITGFVLFPMLMQETKELLLMRNQWDGCCIGVPPTPYDAVEVKLVETATRQDLFVQYATLEGVMKVEPYVNRDWLLGMYILEDTKVLKMTDEGVKRPTHAPGQAPPGGAVTPSPEETSAP